MKSSSLCSFCAEEDETIEHLMVSCRIVQALWSRVFNYIVERFKPEDLDISTTAIIMNQVSPYKRDAINFIVLVVKQFIYRQRCLRKDLDFPIVKAYILSIENVEKYIAVKNNRLATHEKKWSRALDTGSQIDSIDNVV